MSETEWATSEDPESMLRWLSRLGHMSALWDFATDCCRQVYDELPGPRFRKVVELAEDMGRGRATWEMVEEALHRASRALDKLVARHQEAVDPVEQDALNRQIGAAGVVWVFEFQDGFEAALAASRHLIEWANEAEGERVRQANVLRRMAPNPSRLVSSDEE